MSSLDLSGLDKFSELLKDPKGQKVAASNGEPLMLAIELIDEDSDQPRKQFDDASLVELADSIKERGVKTPISVRPHPEQKGRYVVNHGARRLRATQLAGLAEIPAFVDAKHGYVDQLVENIQRENLTVTETIGAVGRLLDDGLKQADIARQTGKTRAWVNKYARLRDMPSEIEALAANEQCTDAQALDVLSRCWADDAEAVGAFLARRLQGGEGERITVAAANTLAAQMRAAGRDDSQGQSVDGADSTAAVNTGAANDDEKAGVEGEGGGGSDAGATKASKGEVKEKPEKVKKPVVQVKVARREGVLLLTKPCAYGLLWVEYEDGSEEEVDANRVKVVAITDSVKSA